MVEFELKRDRIVIRLGTKKWEWTLEPRYWRNTLIWAAILMVAPAIAYFVSPGLINTMISANIYAAIAMPLALMTIGTGRMNFGPQFYIGVGGYTAALLSIAYGWGPLTTLPFAILMSMIAALIFSPLVIMARGLYYVLLTLLLPLVFLEVTFIYTDIFKGDTGLFGIVPLLDTGNAKNNFLLIGYFSTAVMFAYLWIINKVLKSRYGLLMAAINDDEDESELGMFVEDKVTPTPMQSAYSKLLREKVQDVLETLPPREARILRLRFGLENGRTYTLEEVGEKFGLTRERIRQIESKALRRLRHPCRARQLREYL